MLWDRIDGHIVQVPGLAGMQFASRQLLVNLKSAHEAEACGLECIGIANITYRLTHNSTHRVESDEHIHPVGWYSLRFIEGRNRVPKVHKESRISSTCDFEMLCFSISLRIENNSTVWSVSWYC